MKNLNAYALVAVGTIVLSANVFAGPRVATPVNADYLVAEKDLSGWSIGVVTRQRDRDVNVEGAFFDQRLEESRLTGYVGYRLFSWVNVSLYGGQNETTLARYDDSGTALGGTLEFNLLSHLIKDPGLDEDRIRLNSSVSYTKTETSTGFTALDYNEVDADLRLSLVNEVDGNKAFLPQAIAITGGGLISVLQGDLEDAGSSSGFTLGLDLLWTDHITLYGGIETLDETGFFLGVNLML